jgi:hypothetical protein
MSFDYSPLVDIADSLLAEFGRTATLRQRTTGGYDVTANKPTITVTDHTVTIAIFGQPTRPNMDSAVASRSREALISAKGLAVAPGVNDHVIVGADSFKIIESNPVKPGETTVVHQVLLEA